MVASRAISNTLCGSLVLSDMHNRRHFTKHLAVLSLGLNLPAIGGMGASDERKILTVSGPINPDQLGVCLTHEHVMSNFGAERSYLPQYDKDKLLSQVLPYLRQVNRLGGNSLVDCTTAYFGRDVTLLRQLAQQSGLQIITNTGYYGAADDRYVPDHAYHESAETLAQRWIAEFENGIDDTGIRPGFIKVALDSGPVSAIDAKLLRAAALTHAATGLTIACHTGDNPAGAQTALTILQEEGVSPEAWIWTHANKAQTLDTLLPAARAGAWISLDGVRNPNEGNEESFSRHVRYLKAIKQQGLLPQVLLSHDGNSFPRGGAIRPYDAIFTTLVPRLEKEAFTKSDIQQLLVDNPAQAFTIRKRMG